MVWDLLAVKPKGRKQTAKWEKSKAGEADCDCNLPTWTQDNFNVEMQLIPSDQISASVNSFFRTGNAGYHRPRVHAMSEQRPSNLQNILTNQLQCIVLYQLQWQLITIVDYNCIVLLITIDCNQLQCIQSILHCKINSLSVEHRAVKSSSKERS